MISFQNKITQTALSALAGILGRPVTIYHRGEPHMALYVISACQLSCKECSMSGLMKHTPKYQMSLEEVKTFIRSSELSDYKFHYRLTGGEPLLWENLTEGIRLLKQSSSCLSVSIITNALYVEAVTEEVMEMIDCLRISKYLYNKKNIEHLEKKYPNKVVVVDKQEFYQNPKEKVPFSMPVQCESHEMMVHGNHVYPCCRAESIARNLGVNIKTYNEVRVNYKDGLGQVMDTIAEEICTRCYTNKPVRMAVDKVLNVSGSHPNAERLANRYHPRLIKFIPLQCLPRMMRKW